METTTEFLTVTPKEHWPNISTESYSKLVHWELQHKGFMHWADLLLVYGNWELRAAHFLLEKDIAHSPQLHCNKANAGGNSRSPAQDICLVIVFSTWITTLTHSCTPEASGETNSACFISLYVTRAADFSLFYFYLLKENREVLPKYSFLRSPLPFVLSHFIGSN